MNEKLRLQDYMKNVERALGLIDNTDMVEDILDDDLVSINMKVYKLLDDYLTRLEGVYERN